MRPIRNVTACKLMEESAIMGHMPPTIEASNEKILAQDKCVV